ncbi:hypothetical protein [Roseivivax isoporae]|uniref:DUF3329 domain-containing protein n=1 Tax=Roseivivax isoporae LMG 25204 TaxID=1449351 RepID=X7FD43_9RHOB|nr:hypothetical protein [Roseivivax isoporae]ETX30735.1 hypothetical protein RISW2_07980 [Roseivivax isoporae LMG 25204]
MKSLFDLQSPRMRPLWLRIAITGLTLAWALVELSNGAIGWAILFGAAGLWCAWQFFVVWDPDKAAPPRDGQDEGPRSD